jgi:hypothetical protein
MALMSRFHSCEWDGEGPPPEFWDQAIKNALRGRRGQAVLGELREALLALPEPRLIEGSVVAEGQVCAIGALAAHRLQKGPMTLGRPLVTKDEAVVTSLADLEEQFGWRLEDSEVGTVELGQAMGLVRALAWEIAYQNDEEGPSSRETPEERYLRVLAWVERELARGAKA